MSFNQVLERLRNAAKGQRGRHFTCLIKCTDLQDLIDDYDRIDNQFRANHERLEAAERALNEHIKNNNASKYFNISEIFGGDENDDIVNALNNIAEKQHPADAYFLTEAAIHIEALCSAAIELERAYIRLQHNTSKNTQN